MTDRKHELANEPMGRLIVRYAVPPMVALLVMATYNVVDTIFVGQSSGTLALAGLAICFPIQMTIMAAAIGVGIGAASIVSRSLGAKEQRQAERAAGTSFVIAGTMGLIISALSFTFIEPLLELFGATEAVLPYARDYLSIILIGSVFLSIAVSSHNIARSEGNVKIAMTSMILGAVVNTILDPIFIFGLDMGIRGAAVATVIANITSFLFICTYFVRGKSLLRIGRGDLVPDFTLLPEMFRLGGTNFAQMVAGNLMAIAINGTIVTYGDDVHLAIMGVINRSMMFFFLPIFGLVQGLQPIIGFNYGAGDYDRVVEAVRKATIYTTVLATVAFVILMLGPKVLLSVFSSDQALIDGGAPVMRLVVLAMPFIGLQMVGGNMFLAMGKVRPAFVLALSRQVLFLLPLIFILPRFYGLDGLWASFPVADTVAVTVTVVLVRRELRALGRRGQTAVELVEEPTA